MAEAVVLKGAPVAERIRQRAALEAARLKASGITPHLVSILSPQAADARVYADSQKRACDKVGISYDERPLLPEFKQVDLLRIIAQMNEDPEVTGIFIHTPLPAGMNLDEARRAMDPEKDVECVHPLNMGALASGVFDMGPCTAAAVVEMMKESGAPLLGANAVIVGRSPAVGRSVALMLLAEKKGATVTVCHSATGNLAAEAARGDFLVAALGRPGFIKGEMVKPGAVVIDVGTNVVKGADGVERLVGDVDFEAAKARARALTPVPGGVGPVTVAFLLWNIVVRAGAALRKRAEI